jgi:endonuclease/exonuclease/phosphatase family metal-dependent hydrolase
LLKNLSIFLSLLAAAAMFASSLSVFIPPDMLVWAGFLGLGFPVVLIFALLTLLFAIISASKAGIVISAVALILCGKNVLGTVNFSIPTKSENELTILTWNVKNLDLYNWSKNAETKEKILQVLKENRPNILCLQEFYTDNEKHPNLERIRKELGYAYHYFGETFTLSNGKRRWGLITFSDFPVKNSGKITFVDGSKLNACIYTDVEIEGETMRIYNLHFQSIQFSDDDYEYLEKISQNPYPNVASRRIISKIKTGFEKRAIQAEKVALHKMEFEGRTIICGDFNDTYVSYAHRLLGRNMQDSFARKGNGLGKTFVNPTPFLKIDHVLLDKAFKVNSHKVLKKPYSDHYPVKVTFEI